MEEKISSPEGKLLRVNRSILAEGTFAYIKEDMNFRQFLLRGREKVKAEWLLLSLALNILKLHHKIQNDRLGTGLIIPEDFPAGL
ncbi:MAG: transposase, partial [Lachnospiraceae bacterium]|nr:transposase [Lachnospiraceae bacterium]